MPKLLTTILLYLIDFLTNVDAVFIDNMEDYAQMDDYFVLFLVFLTNFDAVFVDNMQD